MEEKVLFESKHCLALKCVLFLFYGGLGCIYPFLQSNMTEKGFDFNEIYSISVIIPIAALFGPLIFALLVDKWAITNAFAYGKRVRILTALSLIASIILYVILMFGVNRTPPPEVCHPHVNFMCNRKGAFIVQEKCSAEGICHDWDYNKAGLLNLHQCSYSCQHEKREKQFESNCYERQEQKLRLAALQDNDSEDDVVDESDGSTAADGNTGGTPTSNDLDGDGIPNDQDPDDDNDGILDSQDDDDDNDGIPDAEDLDDDNDGIPDSVDPDSKMTANDLDGDGIPNDQDDDDDNDGIPDAQDDDDDNDGIPDVQDNDDDNDGIPDSMDSDAKSKGNDLDGDGIPNDRDDDDDNDGIPDNLDPDDDNDGIPDHLDSDDDNDGIPDSRDKDAVSKHNDLDGDGIPNEEDDDDDNDGIPDKEDDDDDNDGIPDSEDIDDDNDGIPDNLEGKPQTNDLDGDGIPNDQDEDIDNDGIPNSEDDDNDNDGIPDAVDVDDDNDGIPDVLDDGSRLANDLDGDGIPNDLDDDDDNDGIPDALDNDDDNDGIPDSIDSDDDNDGISDTQENIVMEFSAPKICHDPAAVNSEEDDDDDDDDVKCYTFTGDTIEIRASIDEHNERDDIEECIYPLDGFKCHVDKAWMKSQEQGCKPVIECLLRHPYDDNSSLLFGTSCDGDEDNDGDDDRGDSTYFYYISIRSLLDFCLLAALALFNTIIVIAVRDPSSGVGDFGRQLVWGAIGWIVFFNDDFEQPYFLFILLNTIAAVILLSPLKMDISPPEEWWKFKTIPQNFFSAALVLKYAKKCWLPFLVALVLGSLWSIIDSIDESHMIDIPANEADESRKLSGLNNVWKTLLLIGDLLAVPALVYSKRIIEVFGTWKILVAAFLSLLVRYILLAIFRWEFWDIIEDLLLPTTLGITWVTLVLHFRDNLPRKVTALAQALPIIAHFGFGRFFGALIGIEYDYDQLENDYEVIAGVLFMVTIVSIVAYRYREILLNYLGQYIPALKPDENKKVTTNGKGETDV
ncbi:uncharacterized protein LOC131438382 isoform X5 [Malaya genurostris]|uniref:uncharacterized protein LOC131438382 isoform X5 n=1 Tax=Malaya genurostris TaxID=325434 RepID=UPI0026F39CB2|nr:uncharacterized protein LOC131438382 isoform X5 [Malaya genurostris]